MSFLTKLKEKRRIKELEKKVEVKMKELKEKEAEKSKDEKHGLSTRLKEINEKLDTITRETKHSKTKKKAFKLPFRVKSQLKKLAKKNKVQVILLQNNRNIKPTIAELKDGMLLVGDKIYNGSANIVWLWNGKFPTVIVPEWDLEPLTPEGLYKDAKDNKRLSEPQTIIIRAMEYKESLKPKTIGGKMLIWLLIGGVVVFYILFAGGK